MTKITILHNPRCSKSREALALIQTRSNQINVIEYLKNTPSEDEISHILSLLGLSARQLMRTKESEYKELGLDNVNLTEVQLIEAMVNTPKLIERPIVLSNGKAAIGRPPENVLAIIE
ncbi:arsenate reductase (glutaredoxin) [Shewanella glacialimarina]|jgi:arsenate reductase|uniref:arsenate reductase (glutaredoxin) n=1 Tax=Shewanella glacialimarina TaxID=2590884 RepID=UPI001CF83AD4|nr:arsenate reductase (glutaredoxin) [Shewanella glacialimarina]UCX04657.1 arsenate reductase (glutaredoxin) [Shewanella glacialimarina]